MAWHAGGVGRFVDARLTREENLAHRAAAGCHRDATLRVDRHDPGIPGARGHARPCTPSFTRPGPEGGALTIPEFASSQAHYCRTADARFYTTADFAMSVGITTLELPGVHSDALQKRLRKRHRILTQSMDGNKRAPEIRGLRITPNVYTTPAELDRLVASLQAG